MTTNETLFFRDRTPFDELQTTVLPALVQARASQQRIRIWCSAAATGQEPYSILMTILEHFPKLSRWNLEILATDLCKSALARAETGIYSQLEVQRGLPIQLLVKYFEQLEHGWQVKPELRRRIRWMPWNLLDDFSNFGCFDIVFCRNVLIYFENQAKADVLSRLAQVIRPDGYLFLGAAESVLNISNSFRRCANSKTSLYTPAGHVPVP